jgi:hypothetical protein
MIDPHLDVPATRDPRSRDRQVADLVALFAAIRGQHGDGEDFRALWMATCAGGPVAAQLSQLLSESRPAAQMADEVEALAIRWDNALLATLAGELRTGVIPVQYLAALAEATAVETVQRPAAER